MAKKGVAPQNVISLQIPLNEVYTRTEALKEIDFGCDRTILARRLEYLQTHLPQTTYFYRSFYNNVVSIDGTKSRWFM